jgi:lipopolysaccharide/colanic/teichoic acid biosynthesis glycosyltransferase
MKDGARSARSGSEAAKRLFDVVGASVLLVILSPLIIALAALVRVRFGPPILYLQQRPGLGGRPFTIYKFRTMSNEAFDADGHEIPTEQRTPVWARRIRSMSLDELPELWNVVRGDMSLVGPRPLLMEYLGRYTTEQARRHEVRPGITGLAQVSGRNALTWEEKFALDVRYVDEHDLRLDLEILVRTVGTVVTREGIGHAGQMDMPEFLGTASLPDISAGPNR